MDELLVKVNSDKAEPVNWGINSKLVNGVICVILTLFAALMIIVGVMQFRELNISSGFIYCLIGVIDLIVTWLYRNGEYN